jgi:Flp pilus assembly protein TadG
MLGFLRKKTAELRRCQSGNAVMLVALGLPVLIGGTGFAVDTAQWYMWKGELQYAADQAAIAGAWAMTKEETEASYVDRAEQEFAANLSQTSEIATEPQVRLEDYASGNDNSVVVTASATKGLPFSFFLTGRIATVAVSAQAAFEEGVVNATSCLVAIDEDDEGAVTIGGSAEFVAGCGISALSTDDEAITVNGSPTIDAGWLYAKGGIDDWFDDPANSDDLVVENFEGLYDPFADLEPPYPAQSQTSRTYSCPTGETTTIFTADTVATRTQTTYVYYERHGSTYTQTAYSGSAFKANVDTTVTEINPTLPALPASNPQVIGPNTTGYVQVDRVSGTRIYETSTTTLTKTYVNARESTTANVGGAAVLLPGTYTDLRLSCDTVFTPGVYVLSGGTLEIHAQYDVTGSGVMFVLTNGAGIIVNGGANVNLTAMTVSELQSAGVPHEDAVKLEGMLIFEDPDSPGSNTQNQLNGNATTILNGTVYLPKSNLDIQGTAGVTSQCLMLVAATITLSGNMQMSSFCPPDLTEDTEVAIDPPRVRLVS